MHEREPIVRQRARQRASTARIRTAGESVGRGGEEKEDGEKESQEDDVVHRVVGRTVRES